MADTDFHVINSSDNSGDETNISMPVFSKIDENSEMSESQIISNPESQEIKVKRISLREITELVNKQTLKGYRAGYEDGFIDGSTTNNLLTVGYGISIGFILSGLLLTFIKQ